MSQLTIGVRLKHAGKLYDFLPGEYSFTPGQAVIVETSRGIEYATVASALHETNEEELSSPLRTIIRPATEEDTQTHLANAQAAKEAFDLGLEIILDSGLEMKLIDVEYTFDRAKVIFYFTADGRIDFRELVKDLAQTFHTRIELRQIGVRDEAKIIGGIGICGRKLCCHAYLNDFAPVSIKMAKEQGLSLNPAKISGCCGRLLCCLNYENENYVEWHKTCPNCTAADFSAKKLAEQAQKDEALEQTSEPKPLTPKPPIDKQVKAEPYQSSAGNQQETYIIIEDASGVSLTPSKDDRKPLLKDGKKLRKPNRISLGETKSKRKNTEKDNVEPLKNRRNSKRSFKNNKPKGSKGN